MHFSGIGRTVARSLRHSSRAAAASFKYVNLTARHCRRVLSHPFPAIDY
jgi:hypothetical protein